MGKRVRLSASQNTYLLRCTCGPANLAFSGRAVEFRGQVRCRACGHTVLWQDLLEAGDSPDGEGAELHVLRP